MPFLAFIVLYKLGDAFAGSLLTPFLLQAMHYSTAEVGVVNKVIGLWLTIAGALAGGALMIRLGLWRSLMLFGVLQMLGNLGFWWLALHGRDALTNATPTPSAANSGSATRGEMSAKANSASASSAWVNTTQPRRRPSSGRSTRSISGAHRNLNV